MVDRKGSFSSIPPMPATEFLRPVRFFSRLAVKHGIVLTSLVLLAMTIVAGLQIHQTLQAIQKSAIAKGRTAAGALVPLVVAAIDTQHPELLKGYFNKIAASDDIDYVQVVDSTGVIRVSSDTLEGERRPAALAPGWLEQMASTSLDREAIAVPWVENPAGVDVFVALVDDAAKSSAQELMKAPHLRIGVNFNEILHTDTPKLIWHMLLLTLLVAGMLVLGLYMMLRYILRPVMELHIGLRAVATGDLDYQVPVYTHDEVGRLAQAFNATTARLKAAFQKIEELATRDPLTNLPNRRTFDERLIAEAARSRRYGHPFGLIMMDIDRFKDVNDKFGHPAGDEVLKFIARIIEVNVRETDLPARVGGEEFAVILPESSADEVFGVAEKLRAAVHADSPPGRAGLPDGIQVTISAGAACSAGHLVTPESMIRAADGAMYQSKGRGRNRVTMAPQSAGKTDMLKGVDMPPEKKAKDHPAGSGPGEGSA